MNDNYDAARIAGIVGTCFILISVLGTLAKLILLWSGLHA